MSRITEFNGTGPIRVPFSAAMQADIRCSVAGAYDKHGTVNISAISEQVRRRHESDNVALEDIEAAVMRAALGTRAAISFDSTSAD